MLALSLSVVISPSKSARAPILSNVIPVNVPPETVLPAKLKLFLRCLPSIVPSDGTPTFNVSPNKIPKKGSPFSGAVVNVREPPLGAILKSVPGF